MEYTRPGIQAPATQITGASVVSAASGTVSQSFVHKTATLTTVDAHPVVGCWGVPRL